MSEAALVTTTEFDRTVTSLSQHINTVETNLGILRSEYNQFKIDIRDELAAAVSGLNAQLVGNRAFSYLTDFPTLFQYANITQAMFNQWVMVDLSSFWTATGVSSQVVAVRLQVESRIHWVGGLESGDGLRYFDVDWSSIETGPTPNQDYYAMPAYAHRTRVSGAKDDSTYADSNSSEVLVPVFYKDSKPYVRRWFGANGGDVTRSCGVRVLGWKY